jgi:hypothetical protein
VALHFPFAPRVHGVGDHFSLGSSVAMQRPGKSGEAECCSQELAALVEHARY